MGVFGNKIPAPDGAEAATEPVILTPVADAVGAAIVVPAKSTIVTLRAAHTHAGIAYSAGETITVQSYDVDVLRQLGAID